LHANKLSKEEPHNINCSLWNNSRTVRRMAWWNYARKYCHFNPL